MSSFEFIRDTITDEIMKHDNDTVHTLIQKNLIRVEIEAGFFRGIWQIDDDEIVSNIYVRDEKRDDLIDLDILSSNLNRIRHYNWMLSVMQSKLA